MNGENMKHNDVLLLQYRTWLEATNHSKATVDLRLTHLRALAARCDLATATEDDVLGLFAARRRQKPASLHALRASLKGFFEWAAPRGYCQTNAMAHVPAVRVPPGVPKPIPEDVYRDALARADERGRLMLLLGGCAGLRLSEFAAVHSDCSSEGFLTSCGKGGRTRRIPIHPALAAALEDVHGYAFPSNLRSREHVGSHTIAAWMRELIPHPYTAHCLRHRFGTMAYRGSHDLRSVQELLGHSSPATTVRYTLIDDADLTAAVRSIAA